jgi:hypothetical protein
MIKICFAVVSFLAMLFLKMSRGESAGFFVERKAGLTLVLILAHPT